MSPQAKRHKISRISRLSRLWRFTSWSPIQADSPDVSLPAANAKPPPKSSMIPQGIFFSTKFQPIRDWAGLISSADGLKRAKKFGVEGKMKRKIAMSMAGVASLLPGPSRASDHPVKNPGDLERKCQKGSQ